MAGPAVEGADDADRASSSAENADSAEGDDGANEGYQQNEAAMNTKESKNWAKIMSKRLMNEIENFLVMKKPEANISIQINKEFATLEVQSGPIISKLIGFHSLCFQGGASTESQINA